MKFSLVGKLNLSSTAKPAKKVNFKAAKLVVRDKSSKAIIARTTSDDAGNFKFVERPINAGKATALEIGVDVPGETTGFQYCTLPPDPPPGMPLMEVCDPGGPISMMVGWTCYNPPCLWEVENVAVSITLIKTGEKKPFEPIELTIGQKGGNIRGRVDLQVAIKEEGVK